MTDPHEKSDVPCKSLDNIDSDEGLRIELHESYNKQMKKREEEERTDSDIQKIRRNK